MATPGPPVVRPTWVPEPGRGRQLRALLASVPLKRRHFIGDVMLLGGQFVAGVAVGGCDAAGLVCCLFVVVVLLLKRYTIIKSKQATGEV